MVITAEQAKELNLKDELAPLRRLKEAKLSGLDLSFERERLFNEELTDIAEAIDDHYLESTFTYGFNGQNVVLPDDKTLAEMYKSGVESARLLASERPEFGFEWMRRQAEADNQDMIDSMMRGELEANTIVELSAYPEEAEAAFGKRDGKRHMENCGYKPNLRRGVVRIARRTDQDELVLKSLSLDSSSLESFQYLQAVLGLKPDKTTQGVLANPKAMQTDLKVEQLAELIIGEYDRYQERITGLRSWRGRPEQAGNSMELLQNSRPVLDFYFNQLEILSDDWAGETLSPQLAKTVNSILNHQANSEAILPALLAAELESTLVSGRLNENSVSVIKRALEIGAWASVVKRLEDPNLSSGPANLNSFLTNAQEAESAGQRMVGCGGATSLFTASRTGAVEQIFGGMWRLEARYSFNRRMHCVVHQKPPKVDPKTKRVEPPSWCGPCGICRGCDNKLKKKSK